MTTTQVSAQGVIGGVALDSAWRVPLPCLDVALEDTAGHVVGTTHTDNRGLFQIPTPGAGVYRLRFETWKAESRFTPWDTVIAGADRLGKYQLRVRVGIDEVSPAPDTAANADPWPRRVRGWPEYPRRLRNEGIAGQVLMRFVVDTSGRVDPGTAQVLLSSNPEFTEAARSFLPKMRFSPARRNHVPVCALIEQPFVFNIRVP